MFSHAGDQLLWTDYERSCWTCPVGDWRIAPADSQLDDADTPSLSRLVTYEPGLEQQWYETHGFGPDDSWIYFSAASEGQNFLASDILRMDLPPTSDDPGLAEAPLDYQRITTTAGPRVGEYWAYDKHAKLSPTGDAMMWLNVKERVEEGENAPWDGSWERWSARGAARPPTMLAAWLPLRRIHAAPPPRQGQASNSSRLSQHASTWQL